MVRALKADEFAREPDHSLRTLVERVSHLSIFRFLSTTYYLISGIIEFRCSKEYSRERKFGSIATCSGAMYNEPCSSLIAFLFLLNDIDQGCRSELQNTVVGLVHFFAAKHSTPRVVGWRKGHPVAEAILRSELRGCSSKGG